MTNAHTARAGLLAGLGGDEKSVARHFVAVSTNAAEVAKFGIDTANMFGFWDWVGGRYSMDSAIGLSTMLAIGPEQFPRHARRLPRKWTSISARRRSSGICPVLMGLLGVWYTDFFGAETVAVLPYEQYLKRFPGLSAAVDHGEQRQARHAGGTEVAYPTGAIYWGEPGTNGQHSFYQLIHQGTRLIPCDFLAFGQPLNPLGRHHDLLMANVFAQTEALAFGKTPEQVKAEDTPDWLVPHRVFEGNRPSNTILAERLTPEALGKLVALYEHCGVHAGRHLADQFLRPMGRGTGQGAGAAYRPGTGERGRDRARARQFHQQPDPPLSELQARVGCRKRVTAPGDFGALPERKSHRERRPT